MGDFHPRWGTLWEIFEAAARAHGDRVALESGDRKLTYRELERRARAARQLLEELGVQRGDRILLFVSRGLDAFPFMLGALSMGAAYVPCDPRFPHERVRGIAADAGTKLVVTNRELGLTGDLSLLFVDDAQASLAEREAVQTETGSARPGENANPSDTAYVIYTSGSSGKPKGVQVPHRAAAAFVESEGLVLDVRPSDVVYQGFSLSFDMSIEEIWTTFAAGALLYVGDTAMVNAGPALATFLSRRGVTVLHSVPTLLAMQENEIPSLRLLNLGGEPCPPELVTRWARSGRRILNTYGPTETTVTATYAELTPGEPVTIGRPLPGYRAYVLDENLSPAPSGEGELCIGGVGVSDGYLNDAALTARKFVTFTPPGASAPERIYRTGDRVRRDAMDRLFFLGRLDDQVKIRGYRVELSEIDRALAAASGAAAATALVEDSQGVATLVGYVVSGNRALDADAIDRALRGTLPSYMVPSVLTVVAELPMLASGKLDRKKLRYPEKAMRLGRPVVAPTSLTELRLHAIWTDLFAPREVSIEDDFFEDLGGHSLRAAIAVSRCRALSGLERLSVADIYSHRTVRSLSEFIDRLQAPEKEPSKERSFQPISEKRYRLCTVAQTLALPILFGVFGLQWVFPYLAYSSLIHAGDARIVALAVALLGYAASVPLLALLGVAAKWLVLGRLAPGDYPLWGLTYFRWWLVRRILSLVPSYLFVGSPCYAWYLRALGAKVGRNVFLGMHRVDSADQLAVGDGSSVGLGASVSNCAVERGLFRVRSTTIGCGARVGNSAVVGMGSTLENSSELDDLSALAEGTVVPSGERWAGAPARRVLATLRTGRAELPSGWRNAWVTAAYLPFVVLMPLFAIAPIMPGLVLLSEMDRATEDYAFLWTAPVLALSFVVATCLQSVLCKWVILGRMREGTMTLGSFRYFRYWLVSRLMDIGLELVRPLYATLYLAPWYRWLGIRVGARTEVSTASSVAFDLLELDDECFIADGVSLGAPHVDCGRLTFAPTRIGRRTFVGNSALVPGGTALPPGVLVGVMSHAPGASTPSDTSWFGSPPIVLPRRQVLTAFDEGSTFRPPARLIRLRLVIEAARILLPITCIILLSSVLISELVDLQEGSLLPWPLLVGFPFVSMLAGVCTAFITVFVKRIVVGRYEPRVAPLWSPFVWRSELVTCLYENLMVPLLLEQLRGTPWINVYLRMLGAKIGRRVYTDTTDITEHDVIVVGDDVALNEDCGLQTHLFEDRIMKIGRVTVGDRASIGSMAIVLYDAVVQEDVTLGDLTLVMKGETIPAGTRWEGSPAGPA